MKARFKIRVFDKVSNKYLTATVLNKYEYDLFTGEFSTDSKSLPDPINFLIEYSTGFVDKDGKEIFEGDLIYLAGDSSVKYRVVWEESFGAFMIETIDEVSQESFVDTDSKLWVVDGTYRGSGHLLS